jgi:uroporphyrinogen III methyltransferase/synthase
VAGFVYLVGAGPGDPKLITVGAVEALGRADVIVADRLVPPEILERYAKEGAEVITRPQRTTSLDQEELNALLVERARRGLVVARLKGGDPFVFGRGGEEAEALVDAGVPFVVIPGVTAAVAAPAYAGIPLTHRGKAGAVAFATGHESDEKASGEIAWAELGRSAATLVLYMSVQRLAQVMARLVASGRAGDEPVAVIERGTTGEQRVVVGTIADIAEHARAAGIRPPALTIVGEVVRLRERIAWFERRRRVLVLTSKDDVPARDDLEVVGVSPLAIRPRASDVAASLAHLSRCGTVVFVSAHAVDVFFAELERAERDARALAGARVAAVGERTAERLARHGVLADMVGHGGGEALAYSLLDAGTSGSALVFGARGGRDELAAVLLANNVAVESVAAYDSVPDVATLDAAWRAHQARPFFAIAFTSPRGVSAFLDQGTAAALGGARIGAIGETTRSALIAAGVSVHAVPERPDLGLLIDALANLE